MESFVARFRNCKTKFLISEIGPFSDLEYEKYLMILVFLANVEIMTGKYWTRQNSYLL